MSEQQTERRVALVTGASRGIGKATAVALAEAGYDVIAAARTLEEGEPQEMTETVHETNVQPVPGGSLRDTVAQIEQAGRRGLPVRCDLMSRADMDALIDTAVAEFGGIDVFVNNARYVGPGFKDRFLDTPYEVLEDSMRVNALAPLYLLTKIAPLMVRQGSGLILHISSLEGVMESAKLPTGHWTGRGGLSYGVSKAAFNRIGPALAKELREDGIAVVNVEPGDVAVERKAVQRGDAYDPRNHDSPLAAARTCALIASSAHPMFYSGLTVYAPEFAVERGLIEPEQAAPGRREEWGQPGRIMPFYSNMARER
ncbi:MAG: SDR family NAD(P)-dependent oxidoreductase [Chloroflexi bacterium]|nr:SDR family NAD(P)-dependent oxidoreductase [Chloroflexota bacterium]